MEREGLEREERKEGGKKRRDSPVFLITEGGHCLWDSIHLLHSAESHFHSDSLFTFKTLFISLSVSLSPHLIPLLHCSTRWVMVSLISCSNKKLLTVQCCPAQVLQYVGLGGTSTGRKFLPLNRILILQMILSRSYPCAGRHLHNRTIKKQYRCGRDKSRWGRTLHIIFTLLVHVN